ncbi:MAG: hypothetical protein WC285_03265 [Candidatus Gracilibacteria bacterium]|jgi:hypothetical protein
MKNITNQKGSIALISILVISTVLLVLVLGTSETQTSTSYQQLNTTSGKYLYYVSESCVEEAMGRIKSNINYPGEVLELENGATCDISVTGGGTKTIIIVTTYDDYTQSYQGEVSVTTNGQVNNIRLLNWQKI